MKLPERPPPRDQLLMELAKTAPARFASVMRSVGGPSVSGKYLHWDELKYREPPAGLSVREWWLALKLGRDVGRVVTPLVGVSGQPFSYVMVDPLPLRLHETDLLAGGAILTSESVINPETRDQYVVRSLMEEAITSSQLEGAATTREVAREMIRQRRDPHDQAERMILNNFNTMRRISDLKDEPLTPEMVFDIHRTVTEGTLDDPSAAGRLRRDDEYKVVADIYGDVHHRPPPADELPERLVRMCEFANGVDTEPFIHPAVRSMILHFCLAHDHPFIDGNGRTARALFYWSMLRRKYWLFEYVSISKIILRAPIQYGAAYLHTETDDNDLTYFLLYHAEVIRKSVEELAREIEAHSRRLQDLQANLRMFESLNHRQRELIGHALRHPGQKYTVESHGMSHNVVTQTARTDLTQLVDRGLLRQRREGKKFIYTPAAGLESRLREPG